MNLHLLLLAYKSLGLETNFLVISNPILCPVKVVNLLFLNDYPVTCMNIFEPPCSLTHSLPKKLPSVTPCSNYSYVQAVIWMSYKLIRSMVFLSFSSLFIK